MSRITETLSISTRALRRRRKVVASIVVGAAALAALPIVGGGTRHANAASDVAVGAGEDKPARRPDRVHAPRRDRSVRRLGRSS